MGSCMCVSLSYYITVQTLNCRSCFRHLNMEKLKQLSPLYMGYVISVTVYGLWEKFRHVQQQMKCVCMCAMHGF